MAKARAKGNKFGAEVEINWAMKGLNGAKRGFNDIIAASKVLTVGVDDNIRLAEEAATKFAHWGTVARKIEGIQYRSDSLRKYIDDISAGKISLSQVPIEIQKSLTELGADYREVLTHVGRDIDGAGKKLRAYGVFLDQIPDKVDGLLAIEKAYKKVNDITKVLGISTEALLKPFEGLVDLSPDLKALFDIGQKSMSTFRETAKKLGLDIDQFIISKLTRITLGKIDPKFKGIINQINKAKKDTLGKYVGPAFPGQKLMEGAEAARAIGRRTDAMKPGAVIAQPAEQSAGVSTQMAQTSEQAANAAMRMSKNVDAANKAVKLLGGVSEVAAPEVGGVAAGTELLGGASAGAAPEVVGAAAGTESLGAAALLANPIVLAVAAAVAVFAGGLALLAKGLFNNIEIMEKFRTTGYRATGSIRDLTDNVTDLSVGLGINREEAIASTDALARAGVTINGLGKSLTDSTGKVLTNREAMASLSKQNAMFAKATGASTDAVAKFQKAMAVLNPDISKQKANLDALTRAARDYGLSGAEVDSIMASLTKNASDLQVIWGQQGFDKITKKFTELSVAGHELGLEQTDLGDRILGNDKAIDSLLAQTGHKILGYDNPAEKMAAVNEAGHEYLEILKKIQDPKIKAYRLHSLGISTDDLRRMERADEISRRPPPPSGGEDLEAAFATSRKTITGAIETIGSGLMGLVTKAVGPLADALAEAFTAVLPYFNQFMTLVGPYIKEMGKEIGHWFKSLKPLAPLFIDFGKLLAAIVVGFVSITTWIFKAAAAVNDWIGSFKLDDALHYLNLLVHPFDALLAAATALKDFLFGSSLLHLAEGIAEVMPSFKWLMKAFWALTHPLEAVREAWDSLWSDTDDTKEITVKQNLENSVSNPIANREVVINDDSLKALTKTYDMIEAVASPIYTVLLSEERNQNARQINELIDSVDRVILLLTGIVNSDDPHAKKSADMLGKLVELAGKSDNKSSYPDRMPDGMGERSSRWWPGI